MPLANASNFAPWLNVALFVAAAAVVWVAGTRLTHYLDAIAGKTKMGRALVGMVLLGGITSLPEIANVLSSSISDSPRLGINNLLGSAAINVLLLAIVDAFVGRDALTSVVAKPSTLMMATLCMLLLSTIAAVIVIGDVLVLGVGVGSTLVCVMSILFLWFSAGYDERAPWILRDRQQADEGDDAAPDVSLKALVLKATLAGVVIFAAGYTLSQLGDALAEQTGIGVGIVGFVLIGVATSMPELSSITAALRIRRYEMAFGQVLGTNFINLSLILVADIAFSGGPVVNELGRFETISALLGAMLTGIFMIGLLEQRNPRVMRMGYDSLAVMVLFGCGVAILSFIR